MTVTSKSTVKKKKKKTSDSSPEKAKAEVDVVESPKLPIQFGIRSYLNQFYNIKTPTEPEAWHLLATAPRKKAQIVCRVFFAIGTMLLILGAIGIIVGYLWPAKTMPTIEETIDDRFFIVEKPDLDVIERIKILKIAALTVFSLGGLTVAITLLLPTCCRIGSDDSEILGSGDQQSEAITIYPSGTEYNTIGRGSGGNSPTVTSSKKTQSVKARTSPPTSPIDKKIPVLEEIHSVQPAANESMRKMKYSMLD